MSTATDHFWEEKMRKIAMLAVCLLFAAASALAAAEYPLRAKFPDATPISTEELKKLIDSGKPVIIDVRSEFEFNTLHINNSLNLPISGVDYAKKYDAIKPKDDATPVVFYCNGVL